MTGILIGIVSCCIGIFIGYLMRRKPDGELEIDTEDPEKDLYSFNIFTSLDNLPRKKYLTIRVSHKKQGLY